MYTPTGSGAESCWAVLVGLPIDGAVNGGFGSNLAPLIGNSIPAPLRILDIRAGALINQVVLDPGPPPHPIGLEGRFQGTIPTLQGLVGQVFDIMPGGDMSVNNLKVAGGEEKLALGEGEDQKDTPKKNRPLLNVLKNNPLNLGAKKDAADGAGTVSVHPSGM